MISRRDKCYLTSSYRTCIETACQSDWRYRVTDTCLIQLLQKYPLLVHRSWTLKLRKWRSLTRCWWHCSVNTSRNSPWKKNEGKWGEDGWMDMNKCRSTWTFIRECKFQAHELTWLDYLIQFLALQHEIYSVWQKMSTQFLSNARNTKYFLWGFRCM